MDTFRTKNSIENAVFSGEHKGIKMRYNAANLILLILKSATHLSMHNVPRYVNVALILSFKGPPQHLNPSNYPN